MLNDSQYYFQNDYYLGDHIKPGILSAQYVVPADENTNTSNVNMSPAMVTLLVAVWFVMSLFGVLIIKTTGNIVVGGALIGIPTLINIILRPSFGLSLMLLVLASGTAIAVPGILTLNKGIGFVLVICFLLNILVSRPNLHLNYPPVLLSIALFGWMIFSILVNLDYNTSGQIFTKIQFIGLVLVVYLIIITNPAKSFLWVLRSYFIGTAATVILSFFTGVTQRSSYRFAATAGGEINENLFSVLIALAMITAVYLLMIDRHLFIRILYFLGILFFIVMIFKSGSRGTLLATLLTFFFIFFRKAAIKNFKQSVLILILFTLFVGTGWFLIKTRRIHETVSERITDVNKSRESIASRMEFNIAAIEVAFRDITGTGLFGWFEETSVARYPHNDTLFSIGIYGLPAGVLFVSFLGYLYFLIRKVPDGPEKIFALSVFIFLVLIGLKGMYLTQKVYWIFITIVIALTKKTEQWVDTQGYYQQNFSTDDYTDFKDNL